MSLLRSEEEEKKKSSASREARLQRGRNCGFSTGHYTPWTTFCVSRIGGEGGRRVVFSQKAFVFSFPQNYMIQLWIAEPTVFVNCTLFQSFWLLSFESRNSALTQKWCKIKYRTYIHTYIQYKPICVYVCISHIHKLKTNYIYIVIN